MSDKQTDAPMREKPILVVRPGLGQLAYGLLLPVIFIPLGVLLWLNPGNRQDASSTGTGIALILIGCFGFAYIAGMRVEVSRSAISKVYLFGLRRTSIPKTDLKVESEWAYNKVWKWTVVSFKGTKRWAFFQLTPFWVLPRAGVAAILSWVNDRPASQPARTRAEFELRLRERRTELPEGKQGVHLSQDVSPAAAEELDLPLSEG